MVSRRAALLVAVVMLALAIRLGYLALVQQPAPDQDAWEYDLIGRSLVAGKGFAGVWDRPTVARAPLYPLFLAGTYAALGRDPDVVRVLQAIVGALTCAASGFLAARIFGAAALLPAALAAALWPALAVYPSLLLTETLAGAVLVLLVLVATVSPDQPATWRRWLLVGVLGGLAALLRAELLPVAMLVVAAAALVHRVGARRVLGWVAAAALGVSVVVLPWTARNFLVSGAVIPVATGLGTGLWLGAHPGDITETPGRRRADLPEYMTIYGPLERDEVALDRALLRAGLAMVAAHPARYVVNAGKRLWRLWVSSHTHAIPGLEESFGAAARARAVGTLAGKGVLGVAHLGLLALSAVGFVAASLASSSRGLALLALVPIAYCALVYAALFSTARYQVPLLPVLAAGVGYGFAVLCRRGEAR